MTGAFPVLSTLLQLLPLAALFAFKPPSALTIRLEDVSRRLVKPLRAPRQSVLPSCVPQPLDHSLSTGKPDISMLGMSRSAMRML